MYQFALKLVGVMLLAGILWVAPASFADSKDLDMADRIYKKYEEREKSKREDRTKAQERAAAERAQSRNQTRQKKRDQAQSQTREVQTRSNQSRSSQSAVNSSKKRSNSRAEEQDDNDVERYVRRAIERDNQSSRASSDSVMRYRERAEDRRSRQSRSSDNVRTEQVSLDQAVNMIRRKTDAQVLSAKSSGTKHRIKVLIDGRRVRTYVVDALSGEIY